MIRVPVQGARLDAELPLDPRRAHYLTVVRRLEAGARLVAFDGAGAEVDVELAARAGGWLLRPIGPQRLGRVGAALTLCYGLPKGDKLETVIRQASELGVGRVRLLACHRSVTRLAGPRLTKRMQRLERVAAEAARQSGRADVMEVEPPVAVATLRFDPAETLWVLHPEGGLAPDAAPAAAPLSVCVGPEGGFDPQERAALAELGATSVRLRGPVLRTETAAPVACALALYRLGAL